MRGLLTGASRGLGRAVAFALAERGVELVLFGRSSREMDVTLSELSKVKGAKFVWHSCDLADRNSVDVALSLVVEPVHLVVHNAGIIERSSISEMADATWDRQMEVNLTAPFRITRAVLPGMLRLGHGRILFVSSISAVLGSKRQAAYHATKAGLLGLMRCLAEEMSNTGITTLAILPGAIDTDMLVGSGYSPRMSAEEVARTLVFYALDGGAGHNGAVIEMFGI